MFAPSIRRFAPFSLTLVALGLSACDTTSGGSARRIAVVEEDTQGTSSVNISSLSDVIQRNPNDPGAYNTRGAAYARVGRTATPSRISTRRFRSIPITRRPTPTGRWPSARPTATIRRWPISPAPSRPTRITARPISAAATSTGPGPVSGCPERPDHGDPPPARIGRGASCARAALPEAGHAPSGDPRFRLHHRPQRLRGAPYAARGQSFVATQQYEKAIEDFNAALNVNNRMPIPGPGAASPTSAWATARWRSRATSARSPSTTATRSPGRAIRGCEPIGMRAKRPDIADLLRKFGRAMLAHVEQLAS